MIERKYKEMTSLLSSSKLPVLYYGIMIILTIIMMRPDVEYSMVVRLFYLAMIFAPLLRIKHYTPFAVTAFYTISYCSFVGLLPFSIIYPFACLLCIWLYSKQREHIPPIVIICVFYFFFISALSVDFEETAILWIGILMILMLSTYIQTKEDLTLFALAFVTVSFVLSVVFLLNLEAFLQSYAHNALGMERSGWMNANDLGGTIGCGTVITTGLILNGEKKPLWMKIYLFATFVISFMFLALNASRGALAAVLIGCIIMLFLNKRISVIYKVLSVVFILIFVYYLFINHYLDLLMVRMLEEGDENSGGGRYDIWGQKIISFQRNDFITQMKGIGQLDCISIGKKIRSHNDFVTALIAYGYIGLILFVYTLLRPLFHNFSIKKTLALLPYMSFLLIECIVLEPIMRGYFIFIAYFLYIYKFSSLYDIKG